MKIIARFTYFSKMVSKRRKRLVRRESSVFLFQCVKMKIIARLHTSQKWCSKRRKRLVRRENKVFLFQGGKMKIIARFTYFSKMVFKTS